MRKAIQTDLAPVPVGTYSQAVIAGNTVYLAGQIALDPYTGMLVQDDFRAEVVRVFENIKAVAEAAGGSLSQVVKLNVYLIDITTITTLNEVMPLYFSQPYPARATIQVCALPKNAAIEVEAVMVRS